MTRVLSTVRRLAAGPIGSEVMRTAGSSLSEGERHCLLAVAFMVAGGGFEPPTFGSCDLTHLSMRVGLYLHPRGMLAIQSQRLPPPFQGLGSVLPYRSRGVGSTDFDE
jgi:hypothetical protein